MDRESPDNVGYYYFIRGKQMRAFGDSQSAHEFWDRLHAMKNELKR